MEHDCRRFHILVVDDDPVARKILTTILAPFYTVHGAASGQEALDFLRTPFRPDLILLDIVMPDMDGLAVCRALQADAALRDIPVLFLTAITETDKEEEGLRLGAVDYVYKPFKPELLKARIRNHLELKRLRDIQKELLSERTSALLDSRRQVEEKSIALRYLFETMGELLASRDHYTSEHALRVAAISTRIGARLGISGGDIETLNQGCLVHDIGKVAIPDDVLLKPGRFDREDRKIMECHPLIGGRIFAKYFTRDRISSIILQHHERLDGSGYPKGLRGDSIDPLSRIVMVADVYEALVARRPYKRPMERGRALDILYKDSVRGLVDGEVVDTLKRVTEDWDPLTITIDQQEDYLATLETFRKKTYFREPLSEFYNYRYLLYLEECRMLCHEADHYHLIKTDFMALKRYNERHGYAAADEALDAIGLEFHAVVERFNNEHGLPENTLMLFRRGADYLIYSETEDAILASLERACRAILREARRKWELRSRVKSLAFDKELPVVKALEQLYR